MIHKNKRVPVGGPMVLILTFLNVLILKIAFIVNQNWYSALTITVPLLIIAMYASRQTKAAKVFRQGAKKLGAINNESNSK